MNKEKQVALIRGAVMAILLLAASSTAQATSWFYGPFSTEIPETPSHIAVGNLDDDPLQDVAAVMPSGNLYVFLSQGDGSFSVEGPWSAGNRRLALVDLNLDGDLDVVSVDQDGDTLRALVVFCSPERFPRWTQLVLNSESWMRPVHRLPRSH